MNLRDTLRRGEVDDGDGEVVETASRRMERLRRRAFDYDTRPGLVAATRALRRRLPGDDRYGDPLSTAGTQPVHLVGRQVSALQPDRDSVARELGLGALQVWQSVSEASGRGRGQRPLAILFTDLVGFSTWALEAGDEAVVALLRQAGHSVEGAVAGHSGTIVKRLGDGVMAVFDSAGPAVAAATQSQRELSEMKLGGYTPHLRAGVHWGRPRPLGGDYLGVDVNIAARVAAAAAGGEVLVSDGARAELDLDDVQIVDERELNAPGTPAGLHVHSVRWRARQ